MARLAKELAAKLDDLSWIPRTHMIKGKSDLTSQCCTLTSSRHPFMREKMGRGEREGDRWRVKRLLSFVVISLNTQK